MAQARRLLAGANLYRREIYVFTDCSHGAWDAGAAAEPDEPGAVAASVLFVDVGAETVRNYSIDAIELSGERLAAGTSLVVEAMISGQATEGARLVALELMAEDGRYVRRGVKPAALEGGSRATVAFELGGLPPGTRQGLVLLDGSDDLAADDLR